MSNLKPLNITAYGNNGTLKPKDLSQITAENDTNTISQLSKRLHEMEIVNLELETIVDERSRKLADVVATNAKFLSIIGHDLRSPFQAIIGALDLIRESYSKLNASEIEAYLDLASNSAYRTINLLDNLLSWTVIQNKEKNFNPVKLNLCDTILCEIENHIFECKQKRVTINHSIETDLFVAADLQMVKTILRNLINNALKYSNTGGEISINAVPNDNFIEVDVIDNGIGISLSAQRDLFDMDGLHSTRGTKNENGTGLGLILCKDFVEIHGGILWIESDTDKGCKMRFTLPKYKNE